jgi:exonuclease VII large subunit
VDESWGWSKLTDAEYSEYLQAEAMAAHLGQFIHKNGKLSSLRKELSNMPSIEWFNVEDGKKTPVKITKHHHSQDLLEIHEEIAEQHRQYEQRVNYFKAKVKNLVSDENARIQKENADMAAIFLKLEESLNREYTLAMDAYKGELLRLTMEFNSQRELDVKSAAALRINVDPRFQKVIDLFMTSEK